MTRDARAILRKRFADASLRPCDHRTMAQTKPFDIGSDDVFALMRDYEALRTWELVRAIGAPARVGER